MKRRGKTSGFVERTLLDIASVVQRAVSFDAVAARRGFLQSCDPRVKLASLVVLLVAALVSRVFAGLVALYAATLVLVCVSSVGLRSFLKRTLPFIPLFSLLVVAPAIFGFVTPGEPVVRFAVFGVTVDITRQGLLSAGILLLRILVSVSLSVLLVLTTKRHALLKALRVFRVPQVFVMTMGMTYRYIYLLLDIVHDSFTAMKSRVGYVSSSVEGQGSSL
jgi:cobalt/nickel transport system permease protein